MDDRSFLVFLFLVLKATTSNGSASHVSLLKIFKGENLSKFKDVSKSIEVHSFSFGPKTGDILVERKKAKKLIWNINKNKDITFVMIAKINKLDALARSTLISIASPVYANLKYFSVYIERSESEDFVEGQYISHTKKEIYRLRIMYQSEGLIQSIRVPLENYLRIGQWFNLMVRFVEESRVRIYIGCDMIKEEIDMKIDRIPSFAEIRLSQDVQEDIWTSDKLITNRFIGEMKTAKFLFGEEGFTEYGPCSQTSDYGMVIEGAEPKVEEIKDDIQIPFSIERLFGEEAAGCYYNWKTYKNGETWENEPCTLCKCQKGTVVCHKVKCENKKGKLTTGKELHFIENGKLLG